MIPRIKNSLKTLPSAALLTSIIESANTLLKSSSPCASSTGTRYPALLQQLASRYSLFHCSNTRTYASGLLRRGGQQHQRPRRGGPSMPRGLPLRNRDITAPEVRLVYPEADKRAVEIVSNQQAQQEAASRGLDLVMASPYASPPVVRLVEWDKVVYALRQKEKAAQRAARESRRLSVPKEVRMGCATAQHDMVVKLDSAKRFLSDGQHVRLVITFRGGREIQTARSKLEEVLDALGALVVVKDPRQLQRPQMNQWVVQLAPSTSPPTASRQE